MSLQETNSWNLKAIISDFISEFPDTTDVFLFGSRAFNTGSLRSDIDLLVISTRPLHSVKIYDWILTRYRAVDIFKSIDNKQAESAINGSHLFSQNGLTTELKAIHLWNKQTGFSNNFTEWIQYTRKGISFEPSIGAYKYTLKDIVRDYDNILMENDFPSTNLGIDWLTIGERLTKKIQIALDFLPTWKRTKGTFIKVELSNEYDFQALIKLILKPWLPDLEPETSVAKFDGQEKFIDFSIQMNRILIEAKHIKDANTEAKSIKEMEGIKRFYMSNTNVRLLIFWVLYEADFDLDVHLLEKTFSDITNRNIIVLTKFFKNSLPSKATS